MALCMYITTSSPVSCSVGQLRFTSFACTHSGSYAALLNDLFGVQVRGGCMCAGPVVQAEMGISSAEADALEHVMLQVTPHTRGHVLPFNAVWLPRAGIRAAAPGRCAPVLALLQQVNHHFLP